MGNEQQSNKAKDNRQPTGLSASSASAVAELTGVSAAQSSRAEGKGADQPADNKEESKQTKGEPAVSADQTSQADLITLKDAVEHALDVLKSGQASQVELDELKAALEQTKAKLDVTADQPAESAVAEAKAPETPTSDQSVVSADQASEPTADEPKAVKAAEAQTSGVGAADANPAEEPLSDDKSHRCSNVFSWIRSRFSAFKVFAHAGKENTERLLKYSDRLATGSVGVEYSLGLYFVTTEHTFADWQFQGAIAATALFGVVLVVLCIYGVNLLKWWEVLAQNDSAANADKIAAESELSAVMLEKAKAETEVLKLLSVVLKDVHDNLSASLNKE